MEHKKSYYAIIPANVRYDNNLIQGAKLLYGEITALCNEKGFCWASNDYFANLYNVSKPTIQNWLKSLEDGRYITREVKYKENSKEIEARYIRIFGGGHQENLVRGHQEIYQDNNTSFNNTSNKAIDEKQALRTRFDSLWTLYPLKKGKESAFKSYQKAIKDGVKDLDILNGIKRYNQELKLKGTKKEYIAYGSTWFSQRRWSDEYENDNNQQNQPTKLQKANEVNWDEIYGKNV